MEFDKKNIIGLIAGFAMIVGSLIFLRGSKLVWFIVVLGVISMALPFVLSLVLESGRQKEKEERFLEFVRDLVENVKAGTPISKGIYNLKTRDYGALSPHVEKLANQISLGIPLTTALFNFAKDTKSKVIMRAVNLISEAEKSGGQIGSILESVARSVNQTENLQKERKAAVYNLIVQGYIIFIIFIVIMLLLQFHILPMTKDIGGESISELSLKPHQITQEDFAKPMLIILLVQAFFAGLVIGKISEGSIKDGIKHSFILLALALLIKTGANALLG